MLEIIDIYKKFGNQSTLDQVRLEIKKGEFFALLGPSGCGKTTLLRILAGLEVADRGKLVFNGTDITDVPVQVRPFHLIFQKYALFPHLNVTQNIEFGLKMKKVDSAERARRVADILNLVGLNDLRVRYPETLSGGQAQRVALARALVNRPEILLLDEPLAALDLKLRQYLQVELKTLQKRLGLTFIFVTHDQDEALGLADRIAVMHAGRIEQVSTPKEIYDRPQTAFVADFVGNNNKLVAEIISAGNPKTEIMLGGKKILQVLAQKLALGAVEIFVRPEKWLLDGGEHRWRAEFLDSRFAGDHFEWRMRLQDGSKVKINADFAGLPETFYEIGFNFSDARVFTQLVSVAR